MFVSFLLEVIVVAKLFENVFAFDEEHVPPGFRGYLLLWDGDVGGGSCHCYV